MDTVTKRQREAQDRKLAQLMSAAEAPKANESVEFLKAKVEVIRTKKQEAAKGNRTDK